jgi:hypothetical protein
MIFSDVLISISTGLTVAVITYALLFSIRPKLVIKNFVKVVENKYITFAIINKGWCKAINIKIEACAVYKIDENSFQTFHFEIDHFDFIMIDAVKGENDNAKRFNIRELGESALRFNKTYDQILNDLLNQKSTLRIRYHALHELSWLGKGFEENFKWDRDKFVKIS